MKLNDTIKAKDGYTIRYGTNKKGEKLAQIIDGLTPLLIAKVRTYEDYLDESENNEMFNLYEVFTTKRGNQFIYWGDQETGDDYLTKVTL